jgi:GTP cyclohydrolase I
MQPGLCRERRMSKTDFILAIQENNSRLIGQILNHLLEPEGISVKVSAIHKGCLTIVAEAKTVPVREVISELVKEYTENANIQNLSQIIIRGCATGQTAIA